MAEICENTVNDKSQVFHTFYQDLPLELKDKLSKIKLVVLDVDGTISDGGIYLDRKDNEIKKFNGKDGMGISLLLKAGVQVALITGRNSPLTERRARELSIPFVIQGKMEKEEAIMELIQSLNLTEEQVAVMGDDINDLPLYEHAGVSACPNDGYHYMQTVATIVLTKDGGKGAARELADIILMAKDKMSSEGNPFFLKQDKIKLSLKQ